jgi:hypothetical protein
MSRDDVRRRQGIALAGDLDDQKREVVINVIDGRRSVVDVLARGRHQRRAVGVLGGLHLLVEGQSGIVEHLPFGIERLEPGGEQRLSEPLGLIDRLH